MGAYEYTALDDKGKEKKGVLEGDTPRQVRQSLREQGWMPLSVEEVRQTEKRKQRQISMFRGVSASDLSLITRQIATLARSGLPVEEALRAVSQQTEKSRLKSMMMGVRSKVMEGHTLATALSDFPHVFNELYRSTVEAGEHSGHLSVVLERLADYTEAREQMQQKMMLALLYPVLVTVVAIAVVTILMAFVVPKVVKMFEHTGEALPLLTQMLIVASDFISNFGIYVAMASVAAFFVFVYLLRYEAIKYQVHRILLNTPMVAKLVRGLDTGRFSRTFSILSASGVPVLDAMRISGQVMTNLPMRAAVNEAAQRVKEGSNIAFSLENSRYFPPMTLHLIASGEASGNLEEMLERAAVNQEREIESYIATLVGLFEPMMLLFMGGAVLVIVLAIMMPILDMNTLVR